eukprot:COSAG02_NODE_1435_length_12610_cov_7.021181_6_plen_73_part_00
MKAVRTNVATARMYMPAGVSSAKIAFTCGVPDCLAIYTEPLTHMLQNLNLWMRYTSVGSRPDVKLQVPPVCH